MFTGRVLLLVAFLFAGQLFRNGLYARPALDPNSINKCPSTGLPQNTHQGSNVVFGTKPLFKLNFNQTREGFLPSQVFRFDVQAQDPSRKFGDVLLSVWSDDDRCGHGHFSTDPTLYYQPKQCTHMVFKNTRGFNHTFSFHWTAPKCGCVVVRARVLSESSLYYLENENIMEGYLTKRLCLRGVANIISKMSQIQRTDLLCKVMDNTQRAEMGVNVEFLHRRKIQFHDVSRLQREAFRIAREQRAHEIKQCCAKVGLEKGDCLGDIRRHRIDQFCADQEPVIPFTSLRHDFMMSRKEDCCWRLGERRYKCFTYGNERAAVPSVHGEFHNDRQHDAFEYLDESDPVNDLEDYPYRLSEEFSIGNFYVEESYESVAQKIPLTKPPGPDAGPKSKSPVASQLQNTRDQPRLKKIYRIPQDESSTPPVTQETEVTSTPEERETMTVPVSRVTQTAKALQQQIELNQMKLNCCTVGKEYSALFKTNDAWGECERAARKYSKSMSKRNRRRCRSFYHRCCVEESKTLFLTTPVTFNTRSNNQHTEVEEKNNADSEKESNPLEVTGAVEKLNVNKEQPAITQPITEKMNSNADEKLQDSDEDIADDDVQNDDDNNDDDGDDDNDDDGDGSERNSENDDIDDDDIDDDDTDGDDFHSDNVDEDDDVTTLSVTVPPEVTTLKSEETTEFRPVELDSIQPTEQVKSNDDQVRSRETLSSPSDKNDPHDLARGQGEVNSRPKHTKESPNPRKSPNRNNRRRKHRRRNRKGRKRNPKHRKH